MKKTNSTFVKYAIALLFISFASLAIGQKAKLKNLNVRAKYQYLPFKPFPADVSAYSVNVTADNTNALTTLGSSEERIAKTLVIPGYHKIPEQVAATVSFEINCPTGTPLKTQNSSKKNKDGTTTYSYWYEATFNGTAMLQVFNPDGSLLSDLPISESVTAKSGTYASSTARKKNFNRNRFYNNNRTELLNAMIEKANTHLASQHGIRSTYKKVELKRLKNKRHPAYKAWKSKEDPIKAAFKLLTPTDNSAYIKAIQPLIAFYEKDMERYDAKDKEEKKMRYACQLNLSMMYLYASDRDRALHYAKMIAAEDVKPKKGQRIVEEITDLDESLKKLGQDSRYFKIDLSEDLVEAQEAAQAKRQAAIEAGDVRFFPDFKEESGFTVGSEVKPAKWVYRDGRMEEGYIVYSETHRGFPDFRIPNKMKLVKAEDGRTSAVTPHFKSLQSIVVDSSIFNVLDVEVGAGLMAVKLKNALVHNFQQFDRTDLVLIFPTYLYGRAFGQTDELEADVAIYDKENDKLHTLKALRGTKHAMKKIVKSCPVALAFIEEKRAATKKKGILTQLMSLEDESFVVEALQKYDTCKAQE